MSESRYIDNLIDLSIEDGNITEDLLVPPDQQSQPIMECTMPNYLIVATGEGRESFDNNPFDCAQKLASRSDDPFDMVEKEACVKARYSMQLPHEVKVGKLLSLSDDNILDTDNCQLNENTSIQENTQKSTTDAAVVNISSTIYHTALVKDLDSESPPVSMSMKSPPDTCSSAFESDESSANSADGCSAKFRKSLENRKRLLKLSIANSTFNSPLSCRTRQGDSGFSTAFAAAAHFSDYILSTESPLKLVDDDVMNEPAPKIHDSEKDFESDLKMLSIPMLRKLPSPVPEEKSLTTNEELEMQPIPLAATPSDLSAIREKLRAKRMEVCNGQDVVSLVDNLKSMLCKSDFVDDIMNEQPPKIPDTENDFEADMKMLSMPMSRKLPSPVPEETSLTTNATCEVQPTIQIATPSDLSVIREKLRAKRMEACNGQDVVSLIDNLKSLLCESDIVGENKKEQANCLLKKLSAALNTEKAEDNNCGGQEKDSSNAPQTIVRQGTFDKDLQPPGKGKFDHTDIVTTTSGDTSRMTYSLQSIQSLSPPKEVAEVMVKSSATYDGEPVTERENLLLPHVDNISPIKTPNFKHNKSSEGILHPDVNDIIEQIGKLFEQHQLASLAINGDDSNGSSSSGNKAQQQSAMCNPTFIVVMPTNSIQPSHIQNANGSVCDNAFDDMTSNSAMRRRSQSLSLHDKVKIVQLPVRTQITPDASETAISPNNKGVPEISTTLDVKTPMRPPTMRRNSFCSGTPLTPLSSLNRAGGMANARQPQNSYLQSRYSLGPSKLQDREAQQQAVVRPIPRTNMNGFKPDLKKRSKQQTMKTSVMASSEPLKAVIPIKKVAPMLTTTTATPEGPIPSSRLQMHKVNLETSMHFLTKSGKIATTSTPMPPSRGGDKICDFPSACSTPASGAIKPSGTVAKRNSRFSISTPTSKLQAVSANSSVPKKRALPEFTKSKSPVRMRSSLGGTLTSGVRERQPIKQTNVAKQTASRMSMRVIKRSSLCAGSATTNKENKKP